MCKSCPVTRLLIIEKKKISGTRWQMTSHVHSDDQSYPCVFTQVTNRLYLQIPPAKRCGGFKVMSMFLIYSKQLPKMIIKESIVKTNTHPRTLDDTQKRRRILINCSPQESTKKNVP